MNDQTLVCDLLKACKEVFETMVFMSVDEDDASQLPSDSDSIIGTITFDGLVEGCFRFQCDVDGARTVTRNMLCMEPQDDIAQQDVNDAIGEIVNMVLGSIKANEQMFSQIHVSIPTVIQGRQIQHDMGENACTEVTKVKLDGNYCAELSLSWRYAEQVVE